MIPVIGHWERFLAPLRATFPLVPAQAESGSVNSGGRCRIAALATMSAVGTRHLALSVALAAVIGLSGCGRKAGLDPPPSAAVPPAPAAATPVPAPGSAGNANADAAGSQQKIAAKNGFDARGSPAAAPGQKKPFPLDFLLQ